MISILRVAILAAVPICISLWSAPVAAASNSRQNVRRAMSSGKGGYGYNTASNGYIGKGSFVSTVRPQSGISRGQYHNAFGFEAMGGEEAEEQGPWKELYPTDSHVMVSIKRPENLDLQGVDIPSSSCTTDYGLYGTMANEQTSVQFKYLVETTAGTSLTPEMLAELENSFSNHLISLVFDECTLDGSSPLISSSIDGISNRPEDEIIVGEECSGGQLLSQVLGENTMTAQSTTSNCNVVLGQFTLYTNSEQPLNDDTDILLDEIKRAMDAGVFRVEGIEAVTFVEEETSANGNNPTNSQGGNANGVQQQQPQQGESSNGDGNLVVGLAVAGAASAVIVMGILFVRRRKTMGGNPSPEVDAGDSTLEPPVG